MKKYKALPIWIDINADEHPMDELTVDDVIERLIRYWTELTGYIDGEPAGVLSVKKGYATFFVGYDGSIIDIDVPREDLDTAILYKGKTLKELLEEDIFYNVNVY